MIVTYYSYKGGVGRTSALANIACLMSSDPDHPQKVLLWDFDLEAPGLHKLFRPKDFREYGFIDIAHQYAETGKIADINGYIYESIIPNVFVLPASGQIDNSYCNKLQAINWLSFFDSNPKEKGHFFKTILDSINSREGEDAFDYILVDSRTGLNDQAGICTEVLSDLLVILFRLSKQNFDGLDHLVPAIKSQLKVRDKEKVDILPVASQVGLAASQKLVSDYRKHAQEIFKSKILYYIRFDQDLVNNEELLCLNEKIGELWPTPPIIDDYKKICDEIRKRNENDSKTQQNKLEKLLEQDDQTTAIPLIKDLLRKRPFLRFAWLALQNISPVKSDQEEFMNIVQDIKKRYENNHFAYKWLGDYYINQIQDTQERDTRNTYLSNAITEFQDALSCAPKPDKVPILRQLSKIKSSQGNIEEAINLLKNAKEILPENNQIALDYSLLYIRRGSNYFTLACQELENMPKEIMQKNWYLTYLYAYLGEKEKASRCLEWLEEKGHTGLPFKLQKAYVLLLEGDKDEALELVPKKINDVMELANWAEFYLCAMEFNLALELINKSKNKREIRKHKSEYKHIETLINFFKQDTKDIEKENVIKAWQDYSDPWNFRELLFFKELCLKRKKIPKGKIDIIEELIRRQDLFDLKTSQRKREIRLVVETFF